MKPRTRLQHRVITLSQSLYYTSEYVLPWAKVECLEHKGFATKGKVSCMDCGETFSPELVSRKRATCPHCGTKLKIEQSRKTTLKQEVYFAFAQVVEEFQVIRNFVLYTHHHAGRETRYYCYEVLQHWILDNGKYETIARNHTVSWYCDSWNGNMEIRKEYRRYYYSYNGAKYDVYPCAYHPHSQFKPEYTRYGINNKLSGLTFLEATKTIPNNSKAETLLKAKQYNLLSHCHDNQGTIERYWPSVKICLRNKYKIKDVKMYFDYLALLRYFDKDLHNAHYVCPKTLKKAHDHWMKKKRKRQAIEEAERKRKKAIEDEKRFKELKAKFFGITFSDGEIDVRVLESVQEHMEEGDFLHHCVFTNDYYLKSDSLIFSASVDGVKTETVEVSLKQMKVVQSRGKCNENTEYHDRIIALVNKNMKLIRSRMKAKKETTQISVAV